MIQERRTILTVKGLRQNEKTTTRNSEQDKVLKFLIHSKMVNETRDASKDLDLSPACACVAFNDKSACWRVVLIFNACYEQKPILIKYRSPLPSW